MDISIDGLDALKRAVARNPAKVRTETGKFITKGMAAYNRGIIRNPWRVGQSGGGAPVDTGNLRDTHSRSVSTWEGRITPNAPYAEAVHDRGRHPRPWLDFVKNQKDNEIRQLEQDLLANITNDLAQ